jgi:hypothetical protein
MAKKMSNSVINTLLVAALMQSADKQKLQEQIRILLGVNVSNEELEKTDGFYNLFSLVSAKVNKNIVEKQR